MPGIFAFAETRDGEIRKVAHEVVTAARTLADALGTEVHAVLLDGLEIITVGAALMQASRRPESREKIFGALDRTHQPALARAVDANPWRTTEELFAEVVRSMLRGTVAGAGAEGALLAQQLS